MISTSFSLSSVRRILTQFHVKQLQQAPVSVFNIRKMVFLRRLLGIFLVLLVSVIEIFAPDPGKHILLIEIHRVVNGSLKNKYFIS